MSLKPKSNINTGLSTHAKSLHHVFNFNDCKILNKDNSKWKTAEAIYITLETDKILYYKNEGTEIETHYADIFIIYDYHFCEILFDVVLNLYYDKRHKYISIYFIIFSNGKFYNLIL